MPQILTCKGCKREINAEIEKYHPQGKNREEIYCRECNKVYHLFLKLRTNIWNESDRSKWDKVQGVMQDLFVNKMKEEDLMKKYASYLVDNTEKKAVKVDDEPQSDIKKKLGA